MLLDIHVKPVELRNIRILNELAACSGHLETECWFLMVLNGPSRPVAGHPSVGSRRRCPLLGHALLDIIQIWNSQNPHYVNATRELSFSNQLLIFRKWTRLRSRWRGLVTLNKPTLATKK